MMMMSQMTMSVMVIFLAPYLLLRDHLYLCHRVVFLGMESDDDDMVSEILNDQLHDVMLEIQMVNDDDD